MKKLILSALLLSSCTSSPQFVQPSAMVWPGEYVVSDRGEGVETPAGEYRVLAGKDEQVKLIKENDPEPSGPPVPYDPAKDKCDEITDAACSPNFVLEAWQMPNDPLYPSQWGYKRMESERAWDALTESPVLVAVIDTGIQPHADLKIEGGYNAITGMEAVFDDNGHGTHVAGSACGSGNNAVGISGTSWACKLLSVKFLTGSGSGSLYDAIKAIDWAIGKGARVINASWGGGGFSQPLYDAIARARDAGVLFVAAAGNEGRNTDEVAAYPACYDLENVLSVAAIGQDGKLAGFSNYGAQTVDLAAPGVSILSTSREGGYLTLSGTSMAAPHVSGLAALLFASDPNMTPAQVKAKLIASVKTSGALSGKVASAGELNAGNAIHGTEPPPEDCKIKKLRRCYDNCLQAFPGKGGLWRKCRKDCRKKFNCPGVYLWSWIQENIL